MISEAKEARAKISWEVVILTMPKMGLRAVRIPPRQRLQGLSSR
jgi:hypothetical protein